MPATQQKNTNNNFSQEITVENLNVAVMTLFNRYYLVISVVCVLIVVAAIGFGIVPAWQGIGVLRQQIARNQAEEMQLSDKLRQLAILTADDSDFASHSALLSETLYARRPFLETLFAISNAASINRVVIDRFEFMPGFVATEAAQVVGSPRDAAAILAANLARNQQYIVFDIAVTGELFNVAQFIHDLERSSPVANVSVGTLTQGDVSTSATLEVWVFYYQRELRVAVDAALPLLSPAGQRAMATLSSFLRPDLSVLGQQGVQGGGRQDLFMTHAALVNLQAFGIAPGGAMIIEGEFEDGVLVDEEVIEATPGAALGVSATCPFGCP